MARASKGLSPTEKIDLLDRLPKNWFADINYQLSNDQKRVLDVAASKVKGGESVWHTWDEVKWFVKEDK